jgi:hypothetical protein
MSQKPEPEAEETENGADESGDPVTRNCGPSAVTWLLEANFGMSVRKIMNE